MEPAPQAPGARQARALRAFAIAPPLTALSYVLTVPPDPANMFTSAQTVGPQFALLVAASNLPVIAHIVGMSALYGWLR